MKTFDSSELTTLSEKFHRNTTQNWGEFIGSFFAALKEARQEWAEIVENVLDNSSDNNN